MNDKKILHIITAISMAGWSLLFRKKGDTKDWFLIYFIKSLISTLIDIPVVKRKYVSYPIRYFPKVFQSNIVFLYIIFPLLCVSYNQFTYKMKPLKTIFSVLLFSIPMTLIEGVLEKKTRLVSYNKGWNALFTFLTLTGTFWIVRLSIGVIRLLDQKRKKDRTQTGE
ncbi:CBO0543 family protein [Bacillus mesophilum]|uniref:Uncharacterized protein n=1 Tax=Bacillus mesophilum TaxID=1071718 RepID=A0A7V7UUM7_9BACI|nr:CBO0543 family protein [Bacillus mesophilum]KAB2332005.1 hypothetical protein F7732_15205 [Bacillus mesophilum]